MEPKPEFVKTVLFPFSVVIAVIKVTHTTLFTFFLNEVLPTEERTTPVDSAHFALIACTYVVAIATTFICLISLYFRMKTYFQGSIVRPIGYYSLLVLICLGIDMEIGINAAVFHTPDVAKLERCVAIFLALDFATFFAFIFLEVVTYTFERKSKSKTAEMPNLDNIPSSSSPGVIRV